MNMPVVTGVIGFGVSAQVFHCPFISSNSNFKLASVVERSGERSRDAYPWVNVLKSVQAALDDPHIELVIITTPNQTHYELAKQALIAGKHVVLEKPFTVSSAEADELITLAQRQKRILTVYQNRRWDGDFLTVKKIVESGVLGELVEYEAHFDRFRSQLRPHAWREASTAGAGILFDLGAHLLDQAQVLFGLPQTITANIRKQRPGAQTDDNFDLMLDYGSLKVTLKAGMLVREPGPHFILHGTKGSYVKYGMDPQEAALRQGNTPGGTDWGAEPETAWGRLHTEMNGLLFSGKIETAAGNYATFYDRLYEAIRAGADVPVKPEEARNTVRLIELARESSERKRTIDVK